MKRGGPLRRTPLKRGTSQLKRTEMKRAATPIKRTAMKSKPTADPIGKETRDEVHVRSHGRCEAGFRGICQGVAVHLHHRQLRRGGNHTAKNLLDLCEACHNAIHHEVKWSMDHGYIVRQTDDPAMIQIDWSATYPNS